MNVKRFLDSLTSSAEYRGQLCHVETIPERPARTMEPERPIEEPVRNALSKLGIESLYTHQTEALNAVRAQANAAIVTGTASGKSLCYHIPVLETLLENSEATALYLFPTKALAQDQLKGLLRLKETGDGLDFHAGTYDGDTPSQTRKTLRERGNIVLTNPDMLHSGVIPRHTSWGRFFGNLAYVVIDEVHTYRGVFGSHVANVIRRLKRVCRHYGATPIFIVCSATIANPKEHVERLIGEVCTLVDDDGSPRGKKYFALWNPPQLGETVERRGASTEAREILVQLISERVQSIAFARSRVVAELIYRYAREDLQRVSPSLARAIRAYRGGYLPNERREIERQLFSGELLGITSTNALELGIDIGSLDAAVLVGYPGSIASTWQQAGRAGRGKGESITFLVGYNAPLDQYLMQHPEYFFAQNPESAVIDPDNPHIALSHLRAAVFELPLSVEEEKAFGPSAPALLDLLDEDRQVVLRGDRWYWTGRGYPSDDFSLRNSTENTYTIVDTTDSRRSVIGSTDEISAFMQLHTEAVYLHQGEPYFVSELNTEERVAYVHRADVDYYTQSVTDRRIRVDDQQMERTWRHSRLGFGDVSVAFITYMFKKIKFYDRDSIGFGQINLPPVSLETSGMWLIPPLETLAAARAVGRSPAEGMLGVANVVGDVLPLFAMCDTYDVGTVVDSSNTGVPTLFLFDRYPGGVGFSAKAFERIEEILEASCSLIHGCTCYDGCPSCVGSPIPPFSSGETDGDARGKVPDKEAALVILHALLEKAPYVPAPRSVRPAIGNGSGEALGDAKVVQRPPSEPLPQKLEMRLRRQVQRLKTTREETR